MNAPRRSPQGLDAQLTAKSFLKDLPLFRDVTATDLTELSERIEMLTCPRGQVIYREGAKATAAFIVKSGVVKLATYSTGGHVVALELAVAGDIFGALCPNNVRNYYTSAFAGAGCALLRIPVAELHHLDLQYKSVQDGLFAKVCTDLKHSQTWRGLALEDADCRIANALLYLYKRLGGTIPLTRASIAELAGTTVETAIRAIGKLAQRQILVASRGMITILSLQALEKLAGG